MSAPFKFAIACTAVCIILIFSLYVFADKPNTHKNGFLRNLPENRVRPGTTLSLKYPAYYIAGSGKEKIYLGNYSASLHLLTVSNNLTDTTESTLSMPSGEQYAWKLSRLLVDSNRIILAEGTTPKLYTGNLENLSMQQFLPKSCFFTVLEDVSPVSFIARSIYVDPNGEKRNVLAKLMADTPFVKIANTLLTKQADGIFCTDGTMDYDKETGKLVYLYHYRNEFIVLDSNLNKIYSGRTIDTNSIAKIKVAETSKGVSKFSAPPAYVNSRVRVTDSKIFVLSSLIADNENQKVIEDNDIIDIYSLNDGKYLSTIYVPVEKDDRIIDFIIKDKKLYALKDKSLVQYSLELQSVASIEKHKVFKTGEAEHL
ncbi:MAG: hypothetical protein EOO02_05105 [Chitinophagaceae bacterium]|nr:MAG: hypothetical protein EOO02_05105 [Chitinophagaceae bacterium]